MNVEFIAVVGLGGHVLEVVGASYSCVGHLKQVGTADSVGRGDAK